MKNTTVVNKEYIETLKLLPKYKLTFNNADMRYKGIVTSQFAVDVLVDEERIGSFGTSSISENGLSFRDDYSKDKKLSDDNKVMWSLLIDSITKEIFPDSLTSLKRDGILFVLSKIVEDKFATEEYKDCLIIRYFKKGEKDIYPNGNLICSNVKLNDKEQIIKTLKQLKDDIKAEYYEIITYYYKDINWKIASHKEGFK